MKVSLPPTGTYSLLFVDQGFPSLGGLKMVQIIFSLISMQVQYFQISMQIGFCWSWVP